VWFETERVGLTAAVDLACDRGFADIAGLLALRLAGFLAVRSYDDDRERTLSAALASARAHGRDEFLIRLLGALFAVRAQRDRYAELPELAAEELAVARRLGDPRGEFLAFTHAGRAARMLGRHVEAIDLLEQALATSRRTETSGIPVANTLHTLAQVHADIGAAERAVALSAKATGIARAAGGIRLVAMHLRVLGITLTEVGRLADARRALTEALEIVRELNDDRGEAWVEHALANLELRDGQWHDASARLDRSLRAQESVGDQEGTAEVLRSLGDLAAARGETAEAVRRLEASLAIWRRLGAHLEQARTLARLARIQAGVHDREVSDILADLGLDRASLRLPPPGDQPCSRR
jgi:tetratricopeptide (TPR) repeat protein